jgi:hypothetical protein
MPETHRKSIGPLKTMKRCEFNQEKMECTGIYSWFYDSEMLTHITSYYLENLIWVHGITKADCWV